MVGWLKSCSVLNWVEVSHAAVPSESVQVQSGEGESRAEVMGHSSQEMTAPGVPPPQRRGSQEELGALRGESGLLGHICAPQLPRLDSSI